MHRIITFLLALVLLFGSCLNENSLHTFGSNANAESQYETLKPGSKGQAVLDARMRLYELGYFTKVPTQTDKELQREVYRREVSQEALHPFQ